MANITITKREELDNEWKFGVNVDGMDFKVELDKEYYDQLTSKHISPDSLIKKSFEFLLRKEGKESILKEFNLKKINEFFPDYEREITI